jgi:pimeloyl-ACP methyl ester carboxylesterase
MVVEMISVGDVELAVQDEGTGRPVLLLHGFPDSASMWRDVIPRLVEAGYRIIAPDQRGFGDSSAPRGRLAYHIDRLVDDVVGLLDALGLQEPVDVVGHDWGAGVSWVLCLTHPDRVRRHVALTVGHPRAYARAGLSQKIKGYYFLTWQIPVITEWYLSARGFRRFRRFIEPHPDADAAVQRMSRHGRLTAGLNWYRANLMTALTRRWPRCRVPTLGVYASADKFLAEDQMTRSGDLMDAEWRYVRINGADHNLPLDQPERVAELVRDWFGTSEPTGPAA